MRDALESWGYRVTTEGSAVVVAGHGTVHRFHGWARVPVGPNEPWRGGFDGAAEPTNPGPAAFGAWLNTPLADTAWQASQSVGHTTNNVAEWQGLIAVLRAAREFGATSLDVIGDSQLVVRQFTGEYRIRANHLAILREEAVRLFRDVDLRLHWVPREQNGRADALSKQGIRLPAVDASRLGERQGAVVKVHGSSGNTYWVDTAHRTCTCPSFQFRRGLCKHLRAALAALPATHSPAR